jgi:solute:Na+ symporter, SSS family
MQSPDLIVIFVYVVGLFVVGGIYGGKVKSSRDLFAAGGNSPWWVSGLSGFMTMFSAGTFVVWGGIAYKHGFVAVSINMCYGVAALLVGWFVAGRWKQSGITTPAEFVRLRFGARAVHGYTWAVMSYRAMSAAVSLYALAVLLCALIPVPEGWFFRDAVTGNLSLSWAIVAFGVIVVVYTVTGGLWAVLMTDVLQFIVLYLAIGFVVPLLLGEVGGVGAFLANLPPGFVALTNSEFTWVFLVGWMAIHFFMVGAEWAFVQRFICVRTVKDARKSAWLFGVLYLVSPLFWMLPPLIFRSIDGSANPEQAYILAAWLVLPAGMLGLMVAAMFSATASMVSSQLNVFAGVLTQDILLPFFKQRPAEVTVIRMGRVMTLILGAMMIGVALMVPRLGGAEKLVLSVTSLIVGPLLLPLIWSLFSRKVVAGDVAITVGVCFAAGALVRFGLGEGSWFAGWPGVVALAAIVEASPRNVDVVIGVVLPALLMGVAEWRRRTPAAGAEAVRELAAKSSADPEPLSVEELVRPARVVGWSLATCAALLALLAVVWDEDRMLLSLAVVVLASLATPALRWKPRG